MARGIDAKRFTVLCALHGLINGKRTNHYLARRYGIFCFSIHFLFVTMSLVPGWRATPLVVGDAGTYVIPANNLLTHGVFSRETSPPYLWEPYRTPGYPALIALSMVLLGDVQWALYWATITAGLAGWCIVRLTEHWGGDILAQHWAGLCMAFLPNSLGLSAALLTDAIFGHLVIFWIFTLLMWLGNKSFMTIGGGTIALFLLQAIKPTMNIAVMIIIGVALLSVRQVKMWILVSVLVVLSLAVPGYFAVRNLHDHGVFSASLLGVEAMREYLQVRFLQETSHQDYGALTAKFDERIILLQSRFPLPKVFMEDSIS